MSVDKKPNFFEPRTIIAFVLTMLVFVLWQNYMKSKYPHVYKPKSKVEAGLTKGSEGQAKNTAEPTDLNKVQSTDLSSSPDLKNQQDNKSIIAEETKDIPEEFQTFEAEKWSADVSNLGLEFKEIQLKEYKQRSLENIFFKDQFKTTFFGLSDPIPFAVTKNDNKIVGVYSSDKGKIVKTLTFNPKSYSVLSTYEIQGDFPGLSVYMELPVNKNAKTSFLFPTFERQEYVVINNDGEDRDLISGDEFATRTFSQVKLLSMGSQFFSNAIVDNSSLKPNALVYAINSNESVVARLDYEFSKNIKSFYISQTYFSGPKDDVILKSVDKEMFTLINFGMFQVICEPILYVLKFFYSKFSNYGIAIILLTLLMRLLVFPIAYRGYKSMDKMQKIQPKLKAIREKYKDDSQKANLETMALMKEEKVNPVGGCLPMLLQLPIFFAFYRVLSESIVMYQAPFMWWITDLSLKDPFYILPVLMGLTMFIQQKLTPTALEPMQQKVMLFMPVIFSVFMISLPSALTLYIFVSTLFGVLQQYLFTKSKTPAPTAIQGVLK
jgi:YidC/Oxa1 family membrane protein insertase